MKSSDQVFAEVASTWTPDHRAEYEAAGGDVDLTRRLAELVHQARTAAGMTQSDLARAIGASRSHVSALERGRSVPSVRTLAKVAKATRRRLRIALDAGWVPPADPTGPDPDGGAEFTDVEWEDFRRAMKGSTDVASRHAHEGNVDG